MANMRLVKLKNRPSKGVFVFEYMQEQIERLRGQGKERTVETYQSALNSFMKFRDGIDLCFDEMDADLMEHYETEMRSTHHLSRNTTSFYMRILRCVYRKAVGEGLALPADPFENVYTGVDKTSKRAATLTDIKHIKQLDLSDHKSLEFARDIFLFSFYMPSNPQPIGFSGILLAKRQNSFYCTYFLHNRNVADTKSPYPIKRLEVIRWFNQKSMVFNQSLS